MIADRLAELFRDVVGNTVPVQIRAWDGSEAGPPGGPALVIRLRRGNGWTALATVPSPLLMTYFLVCVTGARRTENYMEGRSGFDEFQERTAFFVPMRKKPPKSARR